MLELIFFIFIIYMIYKKYNQNSYLKFITFLKNQGFRNISVLQQNQGNYWLKGDFHGDNYLFDIINQNSTISHLTIHTLAEYATKNHYHNIILVPGNSVISESAKKAISEYNIEIWNQNKLIEFFSQNTEKVTSSIIKTSEIHDSCKIDEPNDPIQDGAKANSILGNLFGNKIEKL